MPLVTAGPLNFATAHWLSALMWKSYRYGITQKDLYNVPWRDSAEANFHRYGWFTFTQNSANVIEILHEPLNMIYLILSHIQILLSNNAISSTAKMTAPCNDLTDIW